MMNELDFANLLIQQNASTDEWIQSIANAQKNSEKVPALAGIILLKFGEALHYRKRDNLAVEYLAQAEHCFKLAGVKGDKAATLYLMQAMCMVNLNNSPLAAYAAIETGKRQDGISAPLRESLDDFQACVMSNDGKLKEAISIHRQLLKQSEKEKHWRLQSAIAIHLAEELRKSGNANEATQILDQAASNIKASPNNTKLLEDIKMVRYSDISPEGSHRR